MFQNVEKFFLGTFSGIEQKFLKNLIESACEQGYTKFIDPCCESYYNYLIDLETQRECHIQKIDEQLKKNQEYLNGISYRVLDIWEHVEEVLDDEHAIVVPTGE